MTRAFIVSNTPFLDAKGMKKKQPASERLLTVDEVAEYLNVDKFTVYRLLPTKNFRGLRSVTNGDLIIK